MDQKNNIIVASIVFSIALVLSAIIIALTWKSNYTAMQTISVTGSAQKEIVSDLGVLRGTLSVASPDKETAYRMLNDQMPVVINYLKTKGFPEDEIEFFTINNYEQYEQNDKGYRTDKVSAYIYSQRIEIQSKDVYKIKEVSLDIPSLVEKGLNFNVEAPEYHFTNLDSLKIEMQALASKNAMLRAKNIAEATDRDLGPMTDARMGVLQITPVLSNEVSGYGINDLSSIDKKITAVVSASFMID